jgi:signal transduction histidine kinase
MAGMITEISDMARLQMGRELVLRKSRVDLLPVIRRQVKEAQHFSKKHRIRLETSVTTLTGTWDEVRLTRVLSNLLGNAIKFSPKGGTIEVEVQATVEELTVSVTDQGLGIPEADVPHIFDSFYMASNVVGRVVGSGIGLASAKQIVEQHGGEISIQSREGEGTSVSFSLPLSSP